MQDRHRWRPRAGADQTCWDGGVTAAESAGADALLASTVDRLRTELDGLRQAMASRAVIEQAKGILMAQHRCGPDQAFDLLRRASQHRNVKVSELAQKVRAHAGPLDRCL